MARRKKQQLISKKKRLSKTSPEAKTKEQKFASVFKNRITSVENSIATLAKYSLWIEIIALIMVIATGVLFRLEDLDQWRKQERKAFFNKQPLHTTFDAWFYLSLAKDLVDGTYNPIDEKTGVPDSPPRPSPPPLISAMAAGLAKITPFSMSWIGAVLPTILGPLLAIPLYLTGRYYGGPVMGFGAALMALLYPFYIHRSNIGRFDTDCMNVTWAVAAAYLFLRFGIEKTGRRYIYFLGGIIVYLLFLWWWDQTPAAVGAITFLPLGVALAFFYRPERKEALVFYGILGASAILFLIVKGADAPLKMLKAIWSQYLYISKDTAGDFPNIGITISEQSRPSLDLILNYTTKNILAFIFAIAGIFLLLWKRFRTALFLVSLIVLSALAVTYANRFLIFLIPILALGTGFSLTMLWNVLKRFKPLNVIICPLLLLLFTLPLYNANKAYTQWPKEQGPIVAGMDVAKKKTPQDAVIWAWWDHGHALKYLARRATVSDGVIHGGERTVYTAIPFTTDSYRLAANFMHFYVIRGVKGIRKFYRAVDGNRTTGLKLIKEILGAGPEKGLRIIEKAGLKAVEKWQNANDWLRFFFPPDKRPVYLFLDNLLTRITYWWFWFGTWNIENQNGEHPFYKVFYNIRNKNNMLIGSDGLNINKESGKLHMGNKIIMLSHLITRKKNTLQTKSYEHSSDYRFEIFQQSRFGALMDSNIAESVFNKLFIRHIYPKKYFQPVKLNTPYYQLWEVRGDSISEPSL